MSGLDEVTRLVDGARCWGIELEPRYRVLGVTIEPDPMKSLGVVGEHQLLCFPISTLLVTVTRRISTDEGPRTALVTFGLEDLTAVSERFSGATIGSTPFGQPEPRPGAWGPQHSLEGRTSAADGTGCTLILELDEPDGARLRLFARFDDVELRDLTHRMVAGTTGGRLDPFGHAGGSAGEAGTAPGHDGGGEARDVEHGGAVGPESDPHELRF